MFTLKLDDLQKAIDDIKASVNNGVNNPSISLSVSDDTLIIDKLAEPTYFTLSYYGEPFKYVYRNLERNKVYNMFMKLNRMGVRVTMYRIEDNSKFTLEHTPDM